MFQPFNIISDSEFNLYKPTKGETTNIEIPKEYFNFFPVLKRYKYVKSPNSHYEVFRSLVYQIICNTNKKINPENEKFAIEILEFFTSFMPKYPTSLSDKISSSVIKNLNKISPASAIKLYLTNPILIPHDTDISYIESLRQLAAIKNTISDENFNNLLRQIVNEIHQNTYMSFLPVITNIFTSPLLLHRETPILITLIQKCFNYNAKEILSLDLPSVIMPIKELTPLSLISSLDVPSNDIIFSTLRLYGFSYRLIRHMINDTTDVDEQVNLSLSIQKLLISGYAAIESVIFAILALGKSFFEFLFKCGPPVQYSLITAIICISSCVELPSLKVFLTKYKEQVLKICSIGEMAFPDDGGRKTFINLRKSIEFSSLSPQSLLFGHWLGHTETPVLPLIAIMDEKDELFAPLVMIATNELKNLGDICFSVDICRRLLLTGPSPPAQFAIEAIASIYDPTVIMLNLILGIIPFTLFVPAMELIYRSGQLLNLSQQSIVEAFFYITRKCTTSESPRSIYHLEYLGKHIDKIPKISFFNLFNELMILNEDPRATARFILMITSNPSFFNLIKDNSECMQKLYQKMRQLMQDMTKIDLLATLSISFRNLFKNLADMKLFNNPSVNSFFLIGVNGLSTFANKGILQNLVTAIFCDLSGNPILSPKLASQIRTRLKNKSQFIEYLLKYDTSLAKKEFSDYTQQTSVNVPKFSSKLWGAHGWILYCSSKLYFKN